MSEEMVGFFDGEGKWVTVAEVEEGLGDRLDVPAREAIEELAAIDILRVRRDDDGEVVTAQLSPFAVDLYELPEDTSIEDRAAVYVKHGKTPPEEIREEYIRQLQRKKAGDGEAMFDG